ncbi:15246_t:CDS:2 [Dentiscutata erythropus]|uniref:15246_t:CDS:1 n=1 Tax=Dentiscutata erythropus TaxID=1348616 RepID=A0A9N9HLG0_9GLOM|nr:15246_t:CDS:2 [Dentiscutata erythropus]
MSEIANSETAEIQVEVVEKNITTETTKPTEVTETIEVTEEVLEIAEEKKVESVEETVKENGTKDKEPESSKPLDPISEGWLHKHTRRYIFGKNHQYFEFGDAPIPKENLSLYYKKNVKDVPTKIPLIKPSTEKSEKNDTPAPDASENKDNEDYKKKRIPSGIINLKGVTCQEISSNSNKFKIITENGKEYELEASNEEIKKRWVHTIKNKAEEVEKAENGIDASDGYKDIYNQLVTKQFNVSKDGGVTSDSELLSDGDERQSKQDVEVSPDDAATKSPKSAKSSIFNNLFGKKEKAPETKEESAKDKETSQENRDIGPSETPAAVDSTTATEEKGTQATEETKDEPKDEKKKGNFVETFLKALTAKTKDEKTPTSEAETAEKTESTEPVSEEPTSGGEPAKDEETTEKPKDEPTSKISNLGRRITSVFKKRPEKAQDDNDEQKDDETSKDAVTEGEDKKKKRISMQKKQGSQSEEKQDSETVPDEFEIIQNVNKEYPNAAKQGKLQKESQILKRYEERYFAFHNGTLYYFKDSKTKKQFSIDKSCKVKSLADKKFELETPSRTYKFQASSDDDQTEWTKVIQEYIDSLPESSDKKDEKDELPQVPNDTNTEGIQAAVDQAADASKENTGSTTENEASIAEKTEIPTTETATTATS